MGCWNKTCGLSNLHILSGEEVMVFVLQPSFGDNKCYATAYYQPLLLPFYSMYNDYGGGEHDHGVALNIVMSAIKEQLAELDEGDNEYHDIPVKKDTFDVEMFYNAVHENRLFVRKKIPVDFVMFRKDIVDDILDNYEVEEYVGDGKGTTGWDNNYTLYKFKDIVADVPAFFDRLDEIVNKGIYPEHIPESRRTKDAALWMIGVNGLRDIFSHRESNKVAKYMHRDKYRYSDIVNIDEVIFDQFAQGNRQQAEELLVEYLKASFLDFFMEITRKLWIPGAHEGSQAQEYSGYEALVGAITRAVNREKAAWDE